MRIEYLAEILEGCNGASEVRIAAPEFDGSIYRDLPIIGVTSDWVADHVSPIKVSIGPPTLWIVTGSVLRPWPAEKAKLILRRP